MNVLAVPSPASPRIPELLYAQFQSQFAAVAIGILLGCVAERARIFPTIVFTFLWLTLVYCPMVTSLSTFLISGMLDLEPNRLGIQMGCPRFCRRRTCRNFQRNGSTCILNHSRPTRWNWTKGNNQVASTTQYLQCNARNNISLVRMVWI